jgi:hypothetical protein
VILGVLLEEVGGNHGGHGPYLEVEGMDGKMVRWRGGQILWSKDNSDGSEPRRVDVFDN